MAIKAPTQDKTQHISKHRKSCQKHRQKQSAYGSAYCITAQKCRSAYGGAYKPMPKCLRRCLHYYIVTIGITVVGTIIKLYILLKRLCRDFRIFILILFVRRIWNATH